MAHKKKGTYINKVGHKKGWPPTDPHRRERAERYRKEFGWGFEDSLSILLSSFDEEQIRKALEAVK